MTYEMNSRDVYRDRLAATVIENLKKRNIEGFYCQYSSLALEQAMSMISPGNKVCMGGSHTLQEIGLYDKLKEGGNFTFYDQTVVKSVDERQEILRRAFSADVFFMSTNAITQDGILVNMDGNSNRVAALCFGPKQVIVIAGMNKVVTDLAAAQERIQNEAAPINCIDLHKETPCAKTGVCEECLSANTICCQFVATRYSRHADRIKVILVGEDLGF